MGADDASTRDPRPFAVMNDSTSSVDYRVIGLTASSVQARSYPQHSQHQFDTTSNWSAVQHEFERRLSRFGIKLSEANDSPVSNMPNDFPPLETPTMACFTNGKREPKFETMERQLRQARTEAQIWREKANARDHDLRASYKETMEWRMKYEDLYSAMIQNSELKPQDLAEERGATKSLG
ncbi:hypothetical protein EKO04_007605 [Ascochyta lentis]|uniref:Uncharacterized protein n=1 Tax=Ascochyta lentis TaxID=205686 RepID=A0A8H7J3J1_9PLEO|nr:hypothetical protein EKO04_007605 [Ascochyta lentis]